MIFGSKVVVCYMGILFRHEHWEFKYVYFFMYSKIFLTVKEFKIKCLNIGFLQSDPIFTKVGQNIIQGDKGK